MLKTLFVSLSLLFILSSCAKDDVELYYTLRVESDPGGSVSTTGFKSIPGATLTLTALEGTSIMITAYPEEGYSFDGWSDQTSSNPYAITIDKNIDLKAAFIAN